MMRRISRVLSLNTAIALLLGFAPLSAFAVQKYERVYDAEAHHYVYVPTKTWKQKTRSALKSPIVKDAAIGTAVGVGASALSGESSLLKGAGVGALVGAGTGVINSSDLLRNKPLVRNTASGALIGTGASTVFGQGKLKGAAVGAAAGAGTHFFRKYILEKND